MLFYPRQHKRTRWAFLTAVRSWLNRIAITRNTKETQIHLQLNLDGTGVSEIDTGIPFFDHMLTLFARHGLFDLKIQATGDIEVDYHHMVEDTGIVLTRQ